MFEEGKEGEQLNSNEAVDLIESSANIVVLTGAGVSVDSGIPDFQTYDENWNYDVSREAAISIWYFNQNPTNFWKIYREQFLIKAKSEPNNFHRYLSNLENKTPVGSIEDRTHKITIATQNIDGLHSKAGSNEVFECHGTIQEVICINRECEQFAISLSISEVENIIPVLNTMLPKCKQCNQVLKPNVSLFGEGVHHLGDTRSAIDDADLVIVAGTSLRVGPFNELPFYAQSYVPSVKTLWMNNDEPPRWMGYEFDYECIGSFSEFLKAAGS